MLCDSLVDAFVASAYERYLRKCRPFVQPVLGQWVTCGSQQNSARPSERFESLVERFNHHHHARSATEWRIIDLSMESLAKGAQIDKAHLECLILLSFCHETDLQWGGEVLREDGDYVDSHGHRVFCFPGTGVNELAEPIRPEGKPAGATAWTAPAASDESSSGGSDSGGERLQARSRLDQAMTVAQKRIEAGKQIAMSTRTMREDAGDWSNGDDHTKPQTEATESEPAHVVVDLRPDADRIPGPMPAVREADYGLGRRWGAKWQRSAQGWVTATDGRATWRPVVTNTQELANWDVHTYLGIVTAEVAVEAPGRDLRQVGSTLARGREVGIEGLVDEAVERGAHAVIGVTMQYTPIGTRMLITMTGTAVTLQEKAR